MRAEAEEAKTETAASPSPPKPTLSNSSYAYTGIKTDTTGISVVDVIEVRGLAVTPALWIHDSTGCSSL